MTKSDTRRKGKGKGCDDDDDDLRACRNKTVCLDRDVVVDYRLCRGWENAGTMSPLILGKS